MYINIHKVKDIAITIRKIIKLKSNKLLLNFEA